VRTFYIIFYGVFFGLPLWGIRHLYDIDSSWATPAAGLFAVVAAWEVFSIARGRRRLRRARAATAETHGTLLLAMRDTYTALGGPALSPTRVRDELQAAKDKGVVWSQVIWPIIDAAVARNPNVWRISPPNEPF
jgi:hypothetical protein